MAGMNIKEVAARAKVSTATVSRTINGSSLVVPETAKRVWRVIRQLGYYPNTQARALVRGSSRTFGLIISDIVNPFFPELVKGFEDTAIQHGYEVLLANTGYDSSRTALGVRRMIERQVDGVAIMTSEFGRSLIAELSRRRLPIVFLDVGKTSEHVGNIAVDYAAGIREAVQHLAGLGHRRIGFISGPLSLKSARIRQNAFLECLREAEIAEDPQFLVEGNHKIDGGEDAMRRLLALIQPPTAVLTSNDLTAYGAMRAIFGSGRRVPDDISVVGFDDIAFSTFTQPPLTTVRLSRDELGRTAFETLLQMIEGKPAARATKVLVETSLIVRQSTAPAHN